MKHRQQGMKHRPLRKEAQATRKEVQTTRKEAQATKERLLISRRTKKEMRVLWRFRGIMIFKDDYMSKLNLQEKKSVTHCYTSHLSVKQ